MFLNKIRKILFAPDTKFVSATNFARAGKRGNICVGNNVSAKAIQKRNVVGLGQRSRFLVLTKRSAASGDENATMCPRLPGPLYGWE